MSPYTWFVDVGAIVLGAIGIVLGAFLAELGGPVARWIAERNGFVDRDQTPLVRKVAVRLGSRRPKERVRAVELLRDMGDRTAVPALVRAVQRYDKDPRLLEALVGAVTSLGDSRAVPALRPLARGRNQSLMEAARAAIETLEPGGTLLRPAEPATARQSSLLKPVNGTGIHPVQLLRPTGGSTTGVGE